MKHFAEFSFENEVAKGVGRNALLVGGGLLGYGAGKALSGKPKETPEYLGYNQSQESWNKDPQNDILKEKALSDYDKYINTPELVLYPRRIRDTTDRITNIKDINTEWFSKHIDEFNFKPLVTIDASIYDENIDLDDLNNLYKSKIQNVLTAFLSPQGYKDPENRETYHMTVNKKDRTYVIAEFASEELLKDCLPIDYCDKVKYLEEH
jgi:hypothetical protein